MSHHEEALVSSIVEQVVVRMREMKCVECTLTAEHFQKIQSQTPFFVSPEEHYKQYLRVDRLMSMIDETSGTIRKILVTVLVGALISALFVGILLKIKEF